MMLIDRYLPAAHFRERHRCTVAAPPATILAAVTAYRPDDDPVFRRAIALREWPMRLGRFAADGGATRRPPFGMADFTILDRDDHEIVYGLAGRFWRRDYGLIPVPDGHAFLEADLPGTARLVLNFAVRPTGDERMELST